MQYFTATTAFWKGNLEEKNHVPYLQLPDVQIGVYH